MGTWRANPIYGTPSGGDYVDDTGTVWPDPTGSLRDVQPAPAAAAPAANPLALQPAPAGVDPLAANPLAMPAPAAPAPAPDPAKITSVGQVSPPDPDQIFNDQRRSQAARDAAPVTQGPPDPAGVRQASPFQMVQQTTTDSTRGAQGLSEGSKGAVRAATDSANAAVEAEGQAQVSQLQAQAELEAKQARDAYARGVNTYFQAWGERQMQDEIVRDTTGRLEQGAQFKPDRTALFSGDKGALFGLASAVAAMAGGWMMGRGQTGANPFLPSIFKMIDDNANDQISQNSAVMRELTRRLGSAEAAAKELKARMYGALQDTIEAQTRFEKAPLVQKGAATVLAQVQAKKAQNEMDAAKLTADTVTRQVQTRTQNQLVPNPQAFGGVDVTDPKEYARVGKVSDLANFASEAETLNKDGTLAANVGFLDEKLNWVKDKFNARDPGQARLEALRSRWELLNRADWASEPNGADTQRRLSAIAFPQNDGEISLFMQRVREVVNAADPGGRYRYAAKAMGSRENTVESGRAPIVR